MPSSDDAVPAMRERSASAIVGDDRGDAAGRRQRGHDHAQPLVEENARARAVVRLRRVGSAVGG